MGVTVTVYTKLSPKRALPVTVAELDASIPDLQPAFNEFVRCLKAAAERRG